MFSCCVIIADNLGQCLNCSTCSSTQRTAREPARGEV